MLRYFSYPPLYKVSRSFEIFLSNFNWAGTTGFDLTWSYRERISFEKGLPGQFPGCQIWKDHNILKIFTANILWKLRRRMCAESAIISYLKSIDRETATETETGQAGNEFEQFEFVQWFADLLPTAEKQNVQISRIRTHLDIWMKILFSCNRTNELI